MKTAVLDNTGKKVKDIELKKEVFEFAINEGLVHQLVKAELASLRQGTSSTKTRAQVRGGGAKPWRQKGTGRARAGSSRSPLWRSGGIIFGPTPREYTQKMPRKMRKNALKAVLSSRAKDNKIVVIDKLDIKEPKTAYANEILNNLKIENKVTVITDTFNENIYKSFRNLVDVNIIDVGQLNAYDMLDNDVILLTQASVDRITEVLS